MLFRPFYFLKESFKSFKKNWVISMAAITTVALSLLVIGFFMLIAFTVNSWMNLTEEKIEITVYVKEGVPPESIEALQSEIMSWSEVRKVTYISKDQAMERLKKLLKDSEFLELVEGNPLPVSLEIAMRSPEKASSIIKRLNGRPEIDEIRHDRETVERLIAFVKAARWIGIVFATLLAFASLVLISNAIRLAIYARRKEIGIMRLVGASNWFIRWPFLFEGIIQGAIGAIVAIGLLYVVQVSVIKTIRQALPFVPFSSTGNEFLQLVLGLMLAGMFIGASGSALALRRYLKV
ncbi:MAG: ABC transporter permease [Rubrobacteridae bacterium]|nr:ABC transporter permease [Rubrobacteridae bacterium]